ncbi:MAG: 50S ribosomal protein L6 [Treponemataceae bacterium]
MSRIGNLPVTIPAGVKVNVAENVLSVEGPKGKLQQNFAPEIEIKLEGDKLVVNRKNDKLQTRAYHGLYRSLFSNMIKGVSEGFSKTLVINGVGYKAEVQGKILLLSLGYSNDIAVYIPEGITVTVEQLKVKISGASKEQVGEFAAQVRKLRGPEPYKGKGIRYEDEVILRKVGKTGVK